MISVTFKSMKPGMISNHLIGELCAITLAVLPRQGEYVVVEGNVTHDAEHEALPAKMRALLSGYVASVSHTINEGMDLTAGRAATSQSATVWLSQDRSNR